MRRTTSHSDIDRNALRERLAEGLARLGADAAAVPAPRREQLLDFVSLLAKWNRVHNLTAVRKPRDMLDRHVIDSLALMPYLAPPEDDVDVDLLDIGSGGGLPVLPLAIVRPDLRYLSVESNNKKAGFQRQVVLELGLGQVDVAHSRIEDVVVTAGQVVSRAFASPDDFLRIAAPRCRAGGSALVMLGLADALSATLPEPFRCDSLHVLDVPFADGARHLAICRRPA